MGKLVVSPVARWPGAVVFADPLTWPQRIAWEDAIAAAQPHKGDDKRYFAALLPGLLACVDEWKLENFVQHVTADTFPASPRKDADQLVVWLVKNIKTIWRGDEVPDPK